MPLASAHSGETDFRKHIQPVLEATCISCHGPDKQSAGLRLDKAEHLKLGSDFGPAVVPNDPENSRLFELVAGLDPDVKMPPKGDPLSKEQVAHFKAWIEQGAMWPDGLELMASKGPEKVTHWAFLPPKRPAIPTVQNIEWTRNAIDKFILARLESQNILPSPQADKYTLIRRLSLDLLGLPPRPEEVEDFVYDNRPDAYEQLVERLLASPHYGERWGRHWLDSARYADSDGFEKDTGRPHAWRYRQWVIDALNRNLPFDEFTIQQMAGDLLPNATTEQKVATGFHRNTLTNNEGGVDPEQFRVEQIVNRIDTTAKVFLGATMACSQCHDHKYDPFTQREYYKLFAFFNSDVEKDIPAPLPEEIEPYEQEKKAFDKKLAELEQPINEYRKNELPQKQKEWESDLKLPRLRRVPKEIIEILLVNPDDRADEQKKQLADYYAGRDPKLRRLLRAVENHQNTAPYLSHGQTLALGEPRKTHVMVRGDFLRPGVKVQPGVPAVFAQAQGKTNDATEFKNRLDLAHWLVSKENPLVGRVIVNWVWHKYFGRGIVATLDDFGTRGERPSHPTLLDWLAVEFRAKGWNLKDLHRLIVKSAVYRQSSAYRPELRDVDPLNVLLARQSRLRLEAELVRDAALAVSELLNREIGGKSVRPPQPKGIAELSYASKLRWRESKGADRYRRGMYTWFQRTSPYPMLMAFDAPDSNNSCVRRERSNTPLQALTLLNDEVFVECAQALGRHVIENMPESAGSESDAASRRIERIVEICLGRPATPVELSRLRALLNSFISAAREKGDKVSYLLGDYAPNDIDPAEAAGWVALARTIMNLDEFIVRE